MLLFFFLQIYNESLLSHFHILVVQIILTKLVFRQDFLTQVLGLRASRFVHRVISDLFMMNFLHLMGLHCQSQIKLFSTE